MILLVLVAKTKIKMMMMIKLLLTMILTMIMINKFSVISKTIITHKLMIKKTTTRIIFRISK